jgi:6-phosphogluconolactonase
MVNLCLKSCCLIPAISLWLGLAVAQLARCSDQVHVLIGTYTSGQSKGIYSFRLNPENGTLTPLGAPAETPNPSYVILSKDRRFVYAVNELHGSGDQEGGVSAFRFVPGSGELTFINRVSSVGEDPCYLSLSPDGRELFVANYSSGSLTAVDVRPDGGLAGPVETLSHTGRGPNPERQKSAHVHMVLPAPDDSLLFATDLGEDKIYAYRSTSGQPHLPLTVAEPAFTKVSPGAGPRHFAFGSRGQVLYLIEEMGEEIRVFKRSGAQLTEQQTVRVAPKEWPDDTGAAALHLSPDGKFLYASNRADANELVTYAIDPGSGLLSPGEHQSSLGKKPRDFGIDPSGRWLIVANQDSNSLVVFRRDVDSGRLSPVGQPVEIGSPVCVQIFSAPND